MALLENGRPVADAWTFVPDDQPIPAEGPVIVTLARLTVEGNAIAADRKLGVRLASSELAKAVAPYLERLSLVAVEFPKFRDGRGFSTARELREHYGYTGDIRAVGHTLPDQYRFLLRVGFTQVEAPDDRDLRAWEQALTQIDIAYQRATDAPTPASLLRRRYTQKVTS